MWDYLLQDKVGFALKFGKIGVNLFREECESLAMALTKRGVPCLAYHAGLKDADRSQVQEDWMDGKVAGNVLLLINTL